MDTAKRASSWTTYLLRNGKNTVHMSPIELKDIVHMCFKCSGCVFVNSDIFCFLLFLKVAVMVQRSGEAFSLLYP